MKFLQFLVIFITCLSADLGSQNLELVKRFPIDEEFFTYNEYGPTVDALRGGVYTFFFPNKNIMIAGIQRKKSF